MYDYIERHGYCDECGSGWYVTGDLEGCSNYDCENYTSHSEHEAEIH